MADGCSGILAPENGELAMGQKIASLNNRLNRLSDISMQSWGEEIPPEKTRKMAKNVTLDCGWGKLIFGQTFCSHERIIDTLQKEEEHRRDIAFYINNHHVLLSKAPEMLFLDPSDTLRLWLYNYHMPRRRSRKFRIRLLMDRDDARAINQIYRKCGMVESPEETILNNQKTRVFCYYVAEDLENKNNSPRVIGTIMGVDHKKAFNDPDNGSSFWCLAVDPQVRTRGMGQALVRAVAEHYLAKGRDYLDLSVIHDNRGALKLYKSLGFRKIPVFAVKKKNAINKEFYQGGPKP